MSSAYSPSLAAWLALKRTGEFRGDPSAIKPSWLGADFFTVHKAFEQVGLEARERANLPKFWEGISISPSTSLDQLLFDLHRKIISLPVPLTKRRSIRSINGVSGVTGRRESGRGGMRSWMQARAVPAVSSRIAGLVDLFRSPSEPGTKNSISINFLVASLLI